MRKTLLAGCLHDLRGDLLVGRETIELSLGENELAVDFDFEAATTALNALDRRIREHREDFSGQTGRLG